MPMPRFLAPKGESFEFDQNGTFHFNVVIQAPIVGLIVRYAGYLEQK